MWDPHSHIQPHYSPVCSHFKPPAVVGWPLIRCWHKHRARRDQGFSFASAATCRGCGPWSGTKLDEPLSLRSTPRNHHQAGCCTCWRPPGPANQGRLERTCKQHAAVMHKTHPGNTYPYMRMQCANQAHCGIATAACLLCSFSQRSSQLLPSLWPRATISACTVLQIAANAVLLGANRRSGYKSPEPRNPCRPTTFH